MSPMGIDIDGLLEHSVQLSTQYSRYKFVTSRVVQVSSTLIVYSWSIAHSNHYKRWLVLRMTRTHPRQEPGDDLWLLLVPRKCQQVLAESRRLLSIIELSQSTKGMEISWFCKLQVHLLTSEPCLSQITRFPVPVGRLWRSSNLHITSQNYNRIDLQILAHKLLLVQKRNLSDMEETIFTNHHPKNLLSIVRCGKNLLSTEIW